VAFLAFAWYLYQHITDGYRFLVQNYSAGDRICLFGAIQPPLLVFFAHHDFFFFAGFSRGAYTARALAGMLHKVRSFVLTQDSELS
jgi:uncharacterized protein (DUF2235 family)